MVDKLSEYLRTVRNTAGSLTPLLNDAHHPARPETTEQLVDDSSAQNIVPYLSSVAALFGREQLKNTSNYIAVGGDDASIFEKNVRDNIFLGKNGALGLIVNENKIGDEDVVCEPTGNGLDIHIFKTTKRPPPESKGPLDEELKEV
ncbi:hypothetical protein T265_11855 [Opisthorchis viverrini]|uniref:Uncharacterized protein n=1 Tax=Opisthorchis viverrini TaxID=6198 RepID=A0A074Z1H5_OPIVI|nr:hypothetical protein T265_11855 [Opisthorchis viverrini]KER19337.1 hypothetical protein T265_11855 [Opisthorchis viverrini]